ncbi:M20 aminoacylase family protein [Burkholderia guangdongensis]|uniref:M20 aminoacylase family protein n=1 Tax=Burkholderia guangdongensis TaxID=1792500 RepID=UPI0015CC8B11|nr:M20 aminoacylase family protein [Burkholderia guangdongensis]
MTQASLVPALVERQSDFAELRREVHMYPGLGFEVQRTADLVAARLREWGYEVTTGVGGAGLVGTLKQGTSTRRIGIRADMDALPIVENTGLPWSSKIAGHMHACGHDGHTAILLAAAWHLAQTRNFDGTLHLIFQPDEEGLCGAKAMIDDGLFERFPCDAVYGLHNFPGLAVGTALVVPGPVTASSDRISVLIRGQGGHGAMPHLARDPIVVAAAIVMSLQTIVARSVKPGDLSVVTVGQIKAGSTFNVIPQHAELMVNVRATNVDTQKLIEKRVREIVDAQCAAYGVTADIEVENLVPVMVNHADETAFAADVAREVFGADAVSNTRSAVGSGSEDFAWMLKERPGCYVIIGNGEGSWGGCSVHNPGYDFNDEAIPYGASLWVRLVETYLKQG